MNDFNFGNGRHQHYETLAGGSGAGNDRGGDGVVRRVRFLEPMTAAILSNRRRFAPFGVAGGEPGKPGRNYVERGDGGIEKIGATAEVAAGAGEIFVLKPREAGVTAAPPDPRGPGRVVSEGRRGGYPPIRRLGAPIAGDLLDRVDGR